ncbi:4Fe-4S binding protein [Chryseosolibacter indicus]|uniref:4Fe-4S binding protein n=1 Tax=Chryseosolibacter indicus TaxID=2782351 RepID=A0ABS5VMP9_9BACT|nr:4Fe-4S binding protein [Chryseosolibacter indicus]MBT1702722.1 4Fe-4S binding protein [Chryseosolibacter indicus]
MASEQKKYWSDLGEAVKSLSQGLKLTFNHILSSRKTLKPLSIADKDYFRETEGIATIQYPHQIIPIPDNGRYRLHNEIDDCIVCDKCAKICPVNCITIEPIKAVEEIGKTSDGTSKRIYAAKFDIDMGKCCFCGLCTTVCPTECLTMTKVFDFSVTDIREHNFAFAEMTETQISEKKKILEEHQKSKIVAQAPSTNPLEVKKGDEGATTSTPAVKQPGAPKPVFKPKMKPPGAPPSA